MLKLNFSSYWWKRGGGGGCSIFTCCRKEWRGLSSNALGKVSVAWLVATVEALVQGEADIIVKSSWVGSVSFIAHRCSNILS
jgi:hypothetical protein